jgi:hypothetical protein
VQQIHILGLERMADLSRPERLQVMLNAAELSALDDWRFAKRMPSRAAAIRELLRRGLAVEGIDLGTTGQRSATFGVLGQSKSSSSKRARRLNGSK